MRSPFLFLITRLVQASLISLLLLLGNLSAQAQTIRYVKPVATGTGTGDSWANASSDLQAMITASAANQQVWVAAGTYRPGGNANTDRTISFAMRNGVAIYGGFVGNETDLSQRPAINPISGNPSSSTLSGDLLGDDGPNAANNGDNSYNVISNNNNGLNATAVLDGFVITGGNATNGRGTGFAGGGMINLSSSPTITNCSFISNVSDDSSVAYGGAMHNSNSSPTITNCSFQNNRATGLFGTGGAIYNGGSSSPTITNCSFTGNQARGGAVLSPARCPAQPLPTVASKAIRLQMAGPSSTMPAVAPPSPTVASRAIRLLTSAGPSSTTTAAAPR
ncbi:right-handed parallel beta-helix repeat-containing protein [Spirosoma montaniterrae]|uniref:Right handed beta helix domain-containing protein n=1 Tax=Spirosoma montaniterrae TaxID=1178516 RepID=A0A1P9WSV2_9BACT|nr:right-handed parallel beta-helix repeat-containing protein [Spirosoma montaniterrae]AQG78464.1 hypothetical protein AWR27_03390 [Spirosoma montaniterrae]